MVVIIIILAWVLINTWISWIAVGIDEGYHANEWIGILISCVFSPLAVFGIAQPIANKIAKAKKKKKKF